MQKYVCHDVDFDSSTGTCIAPQWQEDTGMFPPMSGSEGAQIAVAIISVWIVGASFRWAIKALRS